jgi:uncharacterized protein YbjT (DUF2867 family)
MRVLVLGASGGCGRWVVRLAAGAGHEVTALVRPSTSFEPPPNVAVQRGSALDAADLASAMEGQDILISCLGPQRTNPRNPWSRLRLPLHVAELSARAITTVLPRTRIRRVAVISAAGVGDSLAQTNGAMRWMLRHSTVGQMYADLEAMERVLRGSAADWLAVRPVTLVNAAPSARAKRLARYRATSVIGRGDVAAWLLRAATSDTPTEDRTPMIGWW